MYRAQRVLVAESQYLAAPLEREPPDSVLLADQAAPLLLAGPGDRLPQVVFRQASPQHCRDVLLAAPRRAAPVELALQLRQESLVCQLLAAWRHGLWAVLHAAANRTA